MSAGPPGVAPYPMHPPGPPQGPWGPPPQPPKKKVPVLAIVLGSFLLVFGSCVSFCGYQIYQAQTPEGQREAKETHAKDEATLEAFLAKLRRVREALPAADAPDATCPAGTELGRAPIVDTFFVAALLDPDTDGKDAERLAVSKLVRDRAFGDDIVEAVMVRRGADAGAWGFLALGQASVAIDSVNEKPAVIVLRLDEATMPKVTEGAFSGGALAGAAALVDWKKGAILCHVALKAESSGEIEYGGGVRVKVRGIPLPAVGKTGLEEAVEKDFRNNVDAAIHEALKRAGAT